MLRKRKYHTLLSLPVVLFLALTLVVSGFGITPARASQEFQALTTTATLEDLGYAKDETLEGIYVTRDYAVRWPDAWDVQPGNKVDLIFSHSLALRSSSSLAVDWNGTRLTSILLDKSNADHAVLTVEIPEDLIVTGYNRLHLEFYMGIHDDDICRDVDNPASWSAVHRSTLFTFSYSLKTPLLDLSLYPVPLIDNSSMVENRVTFLMPDQPNLAELSALAAVSARLGELASWRTISIDVQPVSKSESIQPQGHLIVIGTPDRITPLAVDPYKSGKFIDQLGKEIETGAGIVWETLSPYDSTAVAIFITGANDDGVVKAAQALSSTATYPRLSGQLGVITDVPDPAAASAAVANRRVFTFEELGYPDETAQGDREQTINYVLPLQHIWQNQSEALLDLHFAHSEILDADQSTLTVMVNNTPVGSIALTLENAVNGMATFHLPARLFVVGDNQISLVANLHLPDDDDDDYDDYYDCGGDTFRESWLVSYSDSKITLPDTPAGLFISLADFPDAYIGATDLSQLAIVVSNPADINTALSLALITEGLGHSAEGELLAPKVIDSQMLFDAQPPYEHQLLIGLPSQNPAVRVVNDRLPQPFEADSDRPTTVEGLAGVSSQSGSVGYIQAASSSQGNPILIVTGTSDEGVLWAARLLNDPDRRGGLKGDLAIIDNPDSVITAEVKYKSADKFAQQETIATTETADPVRPASWITWLAGIVLGITFVLLIIAALIQLPRKQKSREYETHTA